MVCKVARILTVELGLEVANCIIEWVAIADNANFWPQPEKFPIPMIHDVYKIVYTSGERERCDPNQTVNARESIWETKRQWLRERVKAYSASSPLTAIAMVRVFSPMQYRDRELLDTQESKSLWTILRNDLRKHFVENNQPLLPAVGHIRTGITSFVKALDDHSDYDSFRTQFTSKLVAQADQDEGHRLKIGVIFSLLRGNPPIYEKVEPSRQRTFNVGKEINERMYDMTILLEALRKWRDINFSDPLANEALKYLVKAYDLKP